MGADASFGEHGSGLAVESQSELDGDRVNQGDVLRALGDGDEARSLYMEGDRDSTATDGRRTRPLRRLTDAEPDRADYQRALSNGGCASAEGTPAASMTRPHDADDGVDR